MRRLHVLGFVLAAILLSCAPARAGSLHLPPEAAEGMRLLYSGDPDAATAEFRKVKQELPEGPVGWLLEVNARWWKIYCAACEIKYKTIDAWHRSKRPEDADYFALANKAIALAEARLQEKDTAAMRVYAGTGYALKARLHSLRDERKATARAGVKAREHFLRALELDPDVADAQTGLGLYNYYVDTLSALAKVLRFFMGIPGGDKKEGIRQLESGMSKGDLTGVEARFYLAKNLRNYDKNYERAVTVLQPLADQFPRNPVFQLILGDTLAKLNRKEPAAARYRAAEKIASGDGASSANHEAEKPALRDSVCAARVQVLVRLALQNLGAPPSQPADGSP